MKTLLPIILFCGTVALAQEIDREAVATAEVTRYVEDWAANLPPKFRRRALSHVSRINRIYLTG